MKYNLIDIVARGTKLQIQVCYWILNVIVESISFIKLYELYFLVQL